MTEIKKVLGIAGITLIGLVCIFYFLVFVTAWI